MRFFAPAGTPRNWVTKICGVRNLVDALHCHRLGADAVGLNFWPQSKRYLEPDEARTWPKDDLPADLARIGVFVNPALDLVKELLDQRTIDAAQLHGDETPEDCAILVEKGFRVFKAIGVGDRSAIDTIGDYRVDGVVLDAYCPGQYGGSGKTIDWELAREIVLAYPNQRILLSGGLNPSNVARARQRVAPFGFDVASGVEISPGVKDWAKVEKFIGEAH